MNGIWACLQISYEEHFFSPHCADLGEQEKKITWSREGPSEKPKCTIARIPLLLVVPGSAQQVIQRTVCYRMWGKIIGWSRTWGSPMPRFLRPRFIFMTRWQCICACFCVICSGLVSMFLVLLQGELRRWPIYNSGAEAQRTWRRDSQKIWMEYGRENFAYRENKTQNL